MQTITLADGITTVSTSTAVKVRPKNARITVGVSIAGGTSATVQIQGAFVEGGPWFDLGTERSAIGDYVEDVPAMPILRVDVSAVTGSTVDAWAYSDVVS